MGALNLEKIGHDVEKFWLSKYNNGKLKVTFRNPINRVQEINIERKATFKETLKSVIIYISRLMMNVCIVTFNDVKTSHFSIKTAKNYVNFKVNEQAHIDYVVPNNMYGTNALYGIA